MIYRNVLSGNSGEIGGLLQFTVTRSGRLYLALNYSYQGNDGDWTDERWLKEDFETAGWTFIPSTMYRPDLAPERVFDVCYKEVSVGESYTLRCNKYEPPYPILLPPNDTYAVTYDANGATSGTAPVAQTKTHDVALTLASNSGSLLKTGYTFAGWNTAANGSGTNYAVEASYNANAVVTFYAKWTANTYTVTYNGNGSTGGSTANSSHTYAVAKALTSNGFMRSGYAFAGWATSAGGAVAYSNGQSVLNLSATQGATVTFYAKWTANTYTVTYNGNGSTGGSTANSSHTYAVAKALTSNGFTRTGYAFAGWATSAGGAVAYSNGQSVLNLSATQGATVTLYAKWTAVTYTVTYNGNGSTGGSTANSSHTYDAAKALTSNGFTRTGYTFAGWATSAGGAVAYSNGQSVLNLSATQGATVTLYAKWTPITYSVTYDANGATSGTAPMSQTKTHDVALTLATNSGGLLKTGYTFAGWNTAANGSGTNYAEGVSYAADAAIVLYAKWTGALSAVHRFWSDQFGAHFYVMGDSERDRIAAKYPGIWRYETVAWYAYPTQVAGTEPVHRFWSDQLGKHFYIMGDSERDRIAAKYQGIWRYEAVAWYAYPNQVAGSEPVGRFWSNQFMGHFYTITQSEIDRIAAKYPGVWNYETVAYWAFVSPPVGLSADLSTPQPVVQAGLELIPTSTTSALESTVLKVGVDQGLAVSEGSEEFSGTLGLVYPLSYSGREVTAYIYNAGDDQWTCILPATNSPASVVLENVQPGLNYLLDVLAGDSDGGEMASVHRSWFECQLDPPDSIHEDSEVTPQASGGGVGSPIARIKTPVVDGTLTLKLYSSSQGVVKTLTEVPSGETVELSIPEWNRWFWVGGWRDTDDELVLSIWLRHETESDK